MGIQRVKVLIDKGILKIGDTGYLGAQIHTMDCRTKHFIICSTKRLICLLNNCGDCSEMFCGEWLYTSEFTYE